MHILDPQSEPEKIFDLTFQTFLRGNLTLSYHIQTSLEPLSPEREYRPSQKFGVICITLVGNFKSISLNLGDSTSVFTKLKDRWDELVPSTSSVVLLTALAT